MIFFSLKQFNITLLYFFIGLICGLVLQLFEIIFLRKMQKIPIKIIFDAILYGFLCIFYVFLNNFLNFGIFSFIPIIMFLFGILTIKHQDKKIVEFFETVWYNKINKTLISVKQRIKIKKGKSKEDVITKKS